MYKITIPIIVVMLLFSCFSDKSDLTFAAVPTENIADMRNRWNTLIDYLEKETGKKIRFVTMTNYAALRDGMIGGNIDIAYIAPLQYVMTKDHVDITPLVQDINLDGSVTYNSIIIVRADSEYETLEELKGKSFLYVEPGSTSGYLVPMTYFKMELDINPEEYFSSFRPAGSHEGVIVSIKEKHAEAGATNDFNMRRTVSSGIVKAEDFKTVWESDPIPNGLIAIRSSFDEDLIKKVKTLLLNFTMPDIQEVMNINGYTEVKDSDYDPIRKMLKVKNELEGR